MSFELTKSGHPMLATLLPAEEREREMTLNCPKICFIARNHRRADAARSQRDQYVKRQLTKLVGLVAPTLSHRIQQFAGVDPMRFSRSNNVAPIHQIRYEPKLNPGLAPRNSSCRTTAEHRMT